MVLVRDTISRSVVLAARLLLSCALPLNTSALGPATCCLYLQVRQAFIEYSEYMNVEVDRIRANIQKLQPELQARLPEAFWQLHERCVFQQFHRKALGSHGFQPVDRQAE